MVGDSRGISEFKLVWALLEGILPEPLPNDTLNIMRRRFIATTTDEACEEVLVVAEAAEVLGREDRKELQATKHQEASNKDSMSAFRRAYEARRRELVASDPPALAKAQPKGLVEFLLVFFAADVGRSIEGSAGIHHPQDRIAAMAPEGCAVWRDLSKGRWHMHLPPYRRFSRPLELHGESGAGMLILKRAWRLALEDEGGPLTRCPVSGLFTGDAARDGDDYNL